MSNTVQYLLAAIMPSGTGMTLAQDASTAT
jgi:hypothetical protein